ncbi:MAG TPA: hypothetical protein VFE62_29710 [Gemmataceae bacterium]|nr:hypothetical protein [Gemmataceae bacterium]
MKRGCVVGLLLCLLSTGIVFADGPAPRWRFWLGAPVCPPTGCCPNDYLPKPLPCVPRVPCGGPDDYCKKPLPCVPRVPCGGPDDYCKKPLPCLLCPPVSPFLRCGDGCAK